MDKVWLVTGTASGLGRNIAEAARSLRFDYGHRIPLMRLSPCEGISWPPAASF
jgi:hypothetical protein